jgi:hypothetical protein
VTIILSDIHKHKGNSEEDKVLDTFPPFSCKQLKKVTKVFSQLHCRHCRDLKWATPECETGVSVTVVECFFFNWKWMLAARVPDFARPCHLMSLSRCKQPQLCWRDGMWHFVVDANYRFERAGAHREFAYLRHNGTRRDRRPSAPRTAPCSPSEGPSSILQEASYPKCGQEIFIHYTAFRPTHSASYPVGTGGSFSGVKRLGRGADHSPPVQRLRIVELCLHSPVRLYDLVFN